MTIIEVGNYYKLRMTKEKNIAGIFRTTFLLFIFIALSLSYPGQAKAFSLQQIYSPITSFLITVGEKIQYVFAITPENKAKVLEKQAQKRLTEAKRQGQENTAEAENSIKEYQDIKNKPNSVLEKVDGNTLNQIKEQTVEEQKTLVKIGNTAPTMVETVKTVNTKVVEDIKKTVTLKEGTTAGEAFNQKATIVYAPGTGPEVKGSGGQAVLIIEGGEDKFAPGTSGGGQGEQYIEGGELQRVVTGNSETGSGETKVESGDSGLSPGTASGGEGGTKVESGNVDIAPGTAAEEMGN